MDIGKEIKNIRVTHQLTQEQLSEMSGISITSIRKYETGVRTPKPDQLLKISDALGVSINVFMDFEIRTVSDLLSLLFKMYEQTPMDITADSDTAGNYIPGTASITFDNEIVNKKLCSYLSAVEALKDTEQQVAADPSGDYRSRLTAQRQYIDNLKSALLDDNTDISQTTQPPSDEQYLSDTESAGSHQSQASAAVNADIFELLSDCTSEETRLIIENAKLMKQYIRSQAPTNTGVDHGQRD